jgi:hypothetical protein
LFDGRVDGLVLGLLAGLVEGRVLGLLLTGLVAFLFVGRVDILLEGLFVERWKFPP